MMCCRQILCFIVTVLIHVFVYHTHGEQKLYIYTMSGKKRTNSILGITSSNTGRFSKFFQYHNLLEICNKTVIKFPINLKRVVTLPCEILMSKN